MEAKHFELVKKFFLLKQIISFFAKKSGTEAKQFDLVRKL